MILKLSAKSLKNNCTLESFSVSMNIIFEIHLWRNSFFQFTILLAIFVIVRNAPLLKCLTLDISFGKLASRNSIVIHLVYKEDKIIYFLYIFIHTHTHTHTHTQKVIDNPTQHRWSKEDANMVFPAINIYTTAAKRFRKYQKSIMVKLYYTAKSKTLRRFIVHNNLLM